MQHKELTDISQLENKDYENITNMYHEKRAGQASTEFEKVYYEVMNEYSKQHNISPGQFQQKDWDAVLDITGRRLGIDTTSPAQGNIEPTKPAESKEASSKKSSGPASSGSKNSKNSTGSKSRTRTKTQTQNKNKSKTNDNTGADIIRRGVGIFF